MNPNGTATLHDATPEAALAAIGVHKGPVLLDLDETLYLRNSTEDFIDSAQPGAVALLLLRLLDAVRPWRWTGGDATRDVWRVRLITVLFPWTLRNWQARVTSLAEQFTNRPLLAAAKSCDQPPIVATIGFERIVTPLVAAIGLPEARIVAQAGTADRSGRRRYCPQRPGSHRFGAGPAATRRLRLAIADRVAASAVSSRAQRDLPTGSIPDASQASQRTLHSARHPAGRLRLLGARFGRTGGNPLAACFGLAAAVGFVLVGLRAWLRRQ
jgi:hypothetical protein